MSQKQPPPGSPFDWLEYAKPDLAIARAPLPPGAAYENWCFHVQQAAEKAIKAVYRFHGRDFRYTHDIDALLDGLIREGIEVPREVREAGYLTNFATVGRYPGFAEPVAEDEYRQALRLAEAVVHWASRIIEKAEP